MLRVWGTGFWQSTVVDERVRGNARTPGRSDDPGAVVPETIVVGDKGYPRISEHPIGLHEICSATVVNVERQDHRSRLGTLIDQLVTEAYLQSISLRRGGLRAPSGITLSV